MIESSVGGPGYHKLPLHTLRGQSYALPGVNLADLDVITRTQTSNGCRFQNKRIIGDPGFHDHFRSNPDMSIRNSAVLVHEAT